MAIVLLEVGDSEMTKIAMLSSVPKQYADQGFPWDDTEVVHLADDLSVWASHSSSCTKHLMLLKELARRP